jgi:hypothetical protein
VRLRRENLPAPEVLDDPGSVRNETWQGKKGVVVKKKSWGKKKDKDKVRPQGKRR